MKVAVIAGSKSDGEFISAVLNVLKEFNIENSVFITSAHRSPNFTREIALKVDKEYDIAIVLAGLSAALPGVIASYTTRPVIGVPLPAELMGLDALFSVAQMPSGVPVATMGVGKKGAKNAALLAIRILSLSNEHLREKLSEYMKHQEEEVKATNSNV